MHNYWVIKDEHGVSLTETPPEGRIMDPHVCLQLPPSATLEHALVREYEPITLPVRKYDLRLYSTGLDLPVAEMRNVKAKTPMDAIRQWSPALVADPGTVPTLDGARVVNDELKLLLEAVPCDIS